MSKVCICQICTCGRHRCPHHPTAVISKGSAPCLLTEYANKYKQHQIDPVKSCKPEERPQQHGGPMEDKTTNRMDYIPHPYSKPPVKPAEQYEEPQGNFDHLTSYVKDYPPKRGSACRPMKKDLKRANPGKFDGQPTYVLDFRKWPVPPRVRHGADNTYRPSSAPFEGTSNYRTNYQGAVGPPRQSLKPAETARHSDQPFDDETGYRRDYIKHAIPPREMREQAKYSPNKAPLDGMSHYKKDYTAKQAEMTKSCKPEQGTYASDAPFKDDTTQKTDYVKWRVEKPHLREAEQYVKPQGNMDLHTTSHLDYDKKPMARVQAIKPSDRKAQPGKFQGVTNYSTDFRKWGAGERATPKIQTGGYMPPSAKFEGRTNYTDDYHKHSAPPRQSLKPAETARQSDLPFDDTTGYRTEYIKHPLEMRQKKERIAWQPNPARMDDMSHYRKDYTEKKAARPDCFKPDTGPYTSDAPFHGDTTQRQDFKAWPTERPHLHEAESYKKPEGDFDFGTTHKLNYTPKQGEKITVCKPPSRKRDPGRFDGITNYSTDFRKWGMGDRAQPKMQPEYVPNQAPFEGKSSYKDDYIKKNSQVRPSLRPTEKALASDQPFDDHTMYRSEFTKKEVPPCPAAIINTGKSQYVFTGVQDLSGHKFYEKTGRIPSPPKLTQVPTALTVA